MSDRASGKEPQGKRQVWVVDGKGSRHPFLRGMVTHDLVQRGLSFDEAYALARSLRDRLAERAEVSTGELEDLIQEELERSYGRESPGRLAAVSAPMMAPIVETTAEPDRPFSRGLLARSLMAAGIDADRAYRVIGELLAEMRAEGVEKIHHRELARRVGALLERLEGAETAGRYRVVRRIGRLPRPVILYLGGASGTGKSTLAFDLAPLLHVYQINATDTIRQVMRMVFSPAILPGIHRSSWEVEPSIVGDREAGGSAVDLVVDAFEEQATRVCVGVRAVVERAIAENRSIVVEGVHLVPPLAPFVDLEGAAYQVMVMLSVLDEETHRARFLARVRSQGGRRAERYLENVASIHAVQRFLLERAETHEIPVIETSAWDGVLQRSLHLITSLLEQKLPWIAQGHTEARRQPTLYFFLDGLGDHPVRALGGRTPLQAARTPNLDRLARDGSCGLADPVAPDVVPDTAAGSLAIFGQSPLALKRGPVEAIGAGFELGADDVALRANLATVDDEGRIVDRRAARIRSGVGELAAALDRLPLKRARREGVEVLVRPATEHRLAVVLRGDRVSSAILGSDPGEAAVLAEPRRPAAEPGAGEHAVRTAAILAEFEQRARQVLERHPINLRRAERGELPANAILTRGAGRFHRLVPVEPDGRPLRMACVSGDHTVLGIAACLGAEVVTRPEFTANLDTDIASKLRAAIAALEGRDLVVVHLKGADIAAHDGRPERKVEFLERFDAALGALLDDVGDTVRIVVGSDHATLSELGQHGADAVPILIYGPGVARDEVTRFDESAAAAGGLGRFPMQLLLGRLFE